MATLTIRIPDAHRDRLAALAAQRNLSVNELMKELSIRALAEHDTEVRFRMRAAKGDPQRSLEVLDQLDRRHASRVRTSDAPRYDEASERVERPKSRSGIAISCHLGESGPTGPVLPQSRTGRRDQPRK